MSKTKTIAIVIQALYWPSKPDTSPSPARMLESHKKECKNCFRVTTSPVTTIW